MLGSPYVCYLKCMHRPRIRSNLFHFTMNSPPPLCVFYAHAYVLLLIPSLEARKAVKYPSLSLSTLFPWDKVHHWTRILTFWLDWLTSHLHCPQSFLKCLTLEPLLPWWLCTLVLWFHLLWWLYSVFHWILYRPPKVSSGHTGILVFVDDFTKEAMIVV